MFISFKSLKSRDSLWMKKKNNFSCESNKLVKKAYQCYVGLFEEFLCVAVIVHFQQISYSSLSVTIFHMSDILTAVVSMQSASADWKYYDKNCSQ